MRSSIKMLLFIVVGLTLSVFAFNACGTNSWKVLNQDKSSDSASNDNQGSFLPIDSRSGLALTKYAGLSCDEWLIDQGYTPTQVQTKTTRSNIPGHCLYSHVDPENEQCEELERSVKSEFLQPTNSCGDNWNTVITQQPSTESKPHWVNLSDQTDAPSLGSPGQTCNEFYYQANLPVGINALKQSFTSDNLEGAYYRPQDESRTDTAVRFPNKCLYAVYEGSTYKTCVIGDRDQTPTPQLLNSGESFRPTTGCDVTYPVAQFQQASPPNQTRSYLQSLVTTQVRRWDVVLVSSRASHVPKVQYFKMPRAFPAGSFGQTCDAWLSENKVQVDLGEAKTMTKVLVSNSSNDNANQCVFETPNGCSLNTVTSNVSDPNARPVPYCESNGTSYHLAINSVLRHFMPIRKILPVTTHRVELPGSSCATLYKASDFEPKHFAVQVNGVTTAGSCVYKSVQASNGSVRCEAGDWNQNPGNNANPVDYCEDDQGAVYEVAVALPYSGHSQPMAGIASNYRGLIEDRFNLFDIRNTQRQENGLYTWYEGDLNPNEYLRYLKNRSLGDERMPAEDLKVKSGRICMDAIQSNNIDNVSLFYLVPLVRSCIERLVKAAYDANFGNRLVTDMGKNPYQEDGSYYQLLRDLIDEPSARAPTTYISVDTMIQTELEALDDQVYRDKSLTNLERSQLRSVYHSARVIYNLYENLVLRAYLKLTLMQRNNLQVTSENLEEVELDSIIGMVNGAAMAPQSWFAAKRGPIMAALNQGISAANLIALIRNHRIDFAQYIKGDLVGGQRSILFSYNDSYLHDRRSAIFLRNQHRCDIQIRLSNSTELALNDPESAYKWIERFGLEKGPCDALVDKYRKEVFAQGYKYARIESTWRLGVGNEVAKNLHKQIYFLMGFNQFAGVIDGGSSSIQNIAIDRTSLNNGNPKNRYYDIGDPEKAVSDYKIGSIVELIEVGL